MLPENLGRSRSIQLLYPLCYRVDYSADIHTVSVAEVGSILPAVGNILAVEARDLLVVDANLHSGDHNTSPVLYMYLVHNIPEALATRNLAEDRHSCLDSAGTDPERMVDFVERVGRDELVMVARVVNVLHGYMLVAGR